MKDKKKTLKAALIATFCLLVFCALLVWKIKTSGNPQPTPEAKLLQQTPPTQPPDSKVLIGRWVRVDTPYVIEIKAANPDGTLQAGYYNPRSINVSRAEANDKDGKMQVFLELRDVNYPGSNYTLTYDPTSDLLKGVYFQAVMQQSYNVSFRRIKNT